jgi:hypothetical protein
MKKMNENYNLWNNLTFKTTSYRKNFDFISKNENFITEYDGIISETRIDEKKPPIQIGEYQISVWNVKFAKEFNQNLLNNIKEYEHEDTYKELNYLLNNNLISLKNVNKLVLLHTFIIHPDFRKKGVTQEFIEFLYRDFIYGNINNQLLALVKPIQNNNIDFNFFWNERNIMVRQSFDKPNIYETISARNYYGLDEFIEIRDDEISEYKLFNIAKKCGFERVNESHIFKLNSKIIMKRLKDKMLEFNKLDDDLINFL